MTPVIALHGIEKSFGQVTALRGLDLTVEPGHVHGFLGPNGAGKSTTIRILLGILRADAGEARLLDRDPWADAVTLHRHMAYVPGDVELWPNLTGGEAIDLFARLRGGTDPVRRDELCQRFDLDPTKKGRTYSKGNRQKVALIAALASDVQVLLLDEPTAGWIRSWRPYSRNASVMPSRPARPCCCPVTSWPRSRSSPTGSPSSGAARSWKPARWPICVT